MWIEGGHQLKVRRELVPGERTRMELGEDSSGPGSVICAVRAAACLQSIQAAPEKARRKTWVQPRRRRPRRVWRGEGTEGDA